MISPLCLSLAITFYPMFVPEPLLIPEPRPLSHVWAIAPLSKIDDLNYMLRNTTLRFGRIDHGWEIPWEYCQKEGFEE